MRIRVLIVLVSIAILPHLALAQTGCGSPMAASDLPVATPESVGLSGARLCEMVRWLDEGRQSNVHAVLVVRHGKLVFEHYFSGTDEEWGRAVGEVAFGPETKHDERSVTKSIVALMLGIAIDQGLIKSIDEPVLSYFPEYADLRTPHKDRIKVRDLITMSAGLEWHEDDTPYTSDANSENRMDSAPDPYRYALQQAVVAPPGQVWNYNSGATEVVAAVLKKASGKPVDELARTLLFAPLGITDVDWPHNAKGDPIAAGALRLRPRDLAKIGQLVLQRGTWNGARVVSASWIDAAMTPEINVSGFNALFYGYFLWLGRSLVDRREVRWAAAVGLGGQRVFIVPELDLVVVVNAGLYKSALQSSVSSAVLNQYVLKAVAPHP